MAEVTIISSTSSLDILYPARTSGWLSNIFHRLPLNVSMEELSIFLESTALLSWYKKQGILSVPIGFWVSGSIKS